MSVKRKTWVVFFALGALLLASVLIAGCDDPYTIKDYLDDLQKNTPAPAQPKGLIVTGQGWSYNSAGGVITLQDGAVVTVKGVTAKERLAAAPGAKAEVTLDGVSIDLSATSGANALDLGDGAEVTLVLSGTNSLKSGATASGIHVPAGRTLNIDSDNDGTLKVDGGIGGNMQEDGGVIAIQGGTVASNGGDNGAGIGGGFAGDGGEVTISGGVVIAKGAEGSAGIGGGWCGEGGVIRISAGTVFAQAGARGRGETEDPAAIGGGSGEAQEGEVIIGDGPVVVGSGITISVTDGTITLNVPLTIPEGANLSVPEGWTLNTGNLLTNNGTITNDGIVTGEVDGSGVIDSLAVTYHLNGGSLNGVSGESKEWFRPSESYTLPTPTFTDHTFIGWYDNAKFDGSPVREVPADTAEDPLEFWAQWLTVNIESRGSSGPKWYYEPGEVYEIFGTTYLGGSVILQDGANLTLTGGPAPVSVVAESGAPVSVVAESGARVNLRLNSLNLIFHPHYNLTVYGGIFASQAAQLTLLLEGTSYAGGTDDWHWSSALIAAPETIIDSASSDNAGTDASSRSTEGTFFAQGDGLLWYTGITSPAVQGSVTMLGGVLVAQNDHYYAINGGRNDIDGTLTARGGVVIAPHAIESLVYPKDSTAVVFVGNVPAGFSEDDHSDLVVCGGEWTFDAETSAIILNAPLTIHPGVTLRIPDGWTLKLNNQTLSIASSGTVICSSNTASSIAGGSVTIQADNGTITD
ncbi:MAG: InlB B-repeat-containing protein [Spirochaetaceae bacterium]|jgi:hypothetical protein|nr:InlB B-repeat-containing protein [Spirochaetaceae bacterium]